MAEQFPDITTMTGLEVLRWVQENDSDEVPSIRRLLGMSFDEVEEGRVVMSAKTKPDFSNPQGTVHGGIAATMLDSVMGCAVHSTLPAGVGYTTLELKVNYIRAAGLDGAELTATGTVVHTGRKVGTAEGKVVDERGKLIAHGTTTCLIIP